MVNFISALVARWKNILIAALITFTHSTHKTVMKSNLISTNGFLFFHMLVGRERNKQQKESEKTPLLIICSPDVIDFMINSLTVQTDW